MSLRLAPENVRDAVPPLSNVLGRVQREHAMSVRPSLCSRLRLCTTSSLISSRASPAFAP
eukprot:6163716-Amphidinium_carterae.1